MLDASYMMRKQALQTKPRILIDFETRSEIRLKGKDSPGAHKYAEHPSTRILCMGYQIGDGDVKIWWPFFGEDFPEEVRKAVEEGYVFEAHNAGFERAIWLNIIVREYGIPIPLTWADTMASCAYRALPMGLDDAGRVLNLKQQKDKRGDFLIRKLCQPQKLTKKDIKEGKAYPNWCDDTDLMLELGEYCKQDIRSEKELAWAVKDLPPAEYDVWVLDCEINERGVFVDIDAVKAAEKIRAAVEERLTARLGEITGGAVNSGSELDKMKTWLHSQGCHLDDLQADTIDAALARFKSNGLNEKDPCYELLKIRQTLSRASAKKLAKFISMRCKDGRIRGLLAYHGASTGRWAGRGLQPQNFPRPDEDIMSVIKNAKGKADAQASMEFLISMILDCDEDMLETFYGDPMNAIASALRGFIIAEPGNELYVADFSAIEARVLAWVAGEQWKLDAFAGIDRGEGYKGAKDIYLATASMVYGYPCLTKETHAKERQVGKVCELAFGYQGGVGAWRKFDDSDKWTDEEVDEKKRGWREAHENVVQLWYGLEEAAVNAVLLKKPCRYRTITYAVVQSDVGPWLACKLPNGRCLWYYNPRVVKVPLPYGRNGEWRYQLEYEGKDNKKGGAWGRIRTYGGMLTENVVQAISRDLMVEAMFRVTEAGYPIILTVHDEIIAERKKGAGGSGKEFNDLMSVVPPWAKGLPISVAGYVGERYRKD